MKRVLIGMMILLVWLSAASAEAIELGARGYYWFPVLSGDIRVDADKVTGARIDLENDLDIAHGDFPLIEAFAGLGNHHVSLSYCRPDFSSSTTLGRAVTFSGQVFNPGTAVDSALKFHMIDLEYQYDLLDLENILAGFSLGVIGKIKYLEGDAVISSAVIQKSEPFNLPLPMVGLGMHVGILADMLEARAKLTGLGYSGNGAYDASADISLTPLPFVDFHGGYRYMKVEMDDISDVYGDIEFYGPYGAVTVGF